MKPPRARCAAAERCAAQCKHFVAASGRSHDWHLGQTVCWSVGVCARQGDRELGAAGVEDKDAVSFEGSQRCENLASALCPDRDDDLMSRGWPTVGKEPEDITQNHIKVIGTRAPELEVARANRSLGHIRRAGSLSRPQRLDGLREHRQRLLTAEAVR